MVAQIGKTVLRKCPCQGAMNRQAAKTGIEDADVRVYQRKFSTNLNSLRDGSTCAYIIHLPFVETAKPKIRVLIQNTMSDSSQDGVRPPPVRKARRESTCSCRNSFSRWQSPGSVCIIFPMRGKIMAGNKLTIRLTDEQQKQIESATGESISELNIDLASTGRLTEKDLQQLSGGVQKVREYPG